MHPVSDRFFPPHFAAILLASLTLAPGICGLAQDQAPEPTRPPQPSANPAADPASPLMLAGEWVPPDPSGIDFSNLPRVPSDHVVVTGASASEGVNQHAYLARHVGQFWLMWSAGPGIEDRVGQRVKFAVSEDGLTWTEPAFLTPEPPISGPSSPHYNTRSLLGFRWIARGFWPRRGELLALASLDEAADSLGPSLQLRAFRLDPKTDEWHDAGVVWEHAVNDFPPQPLASGAWMMFRHPGDAGVTGIQFVIGGDDLIDQWESVLIPGSEQFAPEDPFWWSLPDGRLLALFRDGRESGRLFRSFSSDLGRSWSRAVRTNFPDAGSSFHGTRLADGRYVLVSHANPAGRDPLVLSISPDGLVFNQMLWLAEGRQVAGPCVVEEQGHLLIAFSSGKQTVEILRVRVADLPAGPAAPNPER